MEATLTESLMLRCQNYNHFWGEKTTPHTELGDIYVDIVTNKTQSLTVKEIVNDLNKEPHAESDDAND